MQKKAFFKHVKTYVINVITRTPFLPLWGCGGGLGRGLAMAKSYRVKEHDDSYLKNLTLK